MQSATLVVDSSVVLKWFVSDSEERVSDAIAILERHRTGEVPLAAPDLIVLELVHALVRRRVAEAHIRDSMQGFLDLSLDLVPVSELAADVVDLVSRCGVTAYDASFAALANHLGVPLITADRRLAGSGACEAVLLGDYEPPPSPPLAPPAAPPLR